MKSMSKEETRAFLLEKPRTAKLASVRADGRPHVAPIWFTLDGDDLIFTTWHTTVKAANLHNNPRVAICVDDDAPPYAFVLIEGTARVEAHAKDLLHWTTPCRTLHGQGAGRILWRAQCRGGRIAGAGHANQDHRPKRNCRLKRSWVGDCNRCQRCFVKLWELQC